MLSTCVGVTSSLTAAEVAMLTSAWAELLTQASVNNDTVSYCVHFNMCMNVNYWEQQNENLVAIHNMWDSA